MPRDLWVHVPPSPDGQNGDTMAKLNAAFAWGGEALMVQTVEEYTGVHIDHVGADRLRRVRPGYRRRRRRGHERGGDDHVDPPAVPDVQPPARTIFNGEEALDYVRQRYQFPDGDFARMRHQQHVPQGAAGQGGEPGHGDQHQQHEVDFVTSVADAMTVDQDFSLIDLGWQFRGLRSENLVFLTSPTPGTDTIGGPERGALGQGEGVGDVRCRGQRHARRLARPGTARPRPPGG